MRYFIYSLLVSAALATVACQQEATTPLAATTSINVPALLQRSAAIQNGTEWDATQSKYQKYRLALEQDPTSAIDALSLVELFSKEARITGEHGHYYPAALQLTDAVLALDSLDKDMKFYALTLKAGVMLSQHEFAGALELAKEAEAMRPRNAQIQGVLVDSYVELGMYEEAVKAADAMMEIRPDLRSYARISYLREIHGDIPGAQEAMKMAIMAGMPGTEEKAWASLELAQLLERNGEIAKATELLELILEQRPDYPFAKGVLAEIALAAGNKAYAKTLLTEAIAAIPEVGFYVTLAELQKSEGKEEAFAKTTKDILIMLQEDVDSGHNMDLEYAHVYLNLLEDPTKALQYMKSAYDARPENIDVNRELALIYRALGEQSLMETHRQRAQRTNSRHPDLAVLAKASPRVVTQG